MNRNRFLGYIFKSLYHPVVVGTAKRLLHPFPVLDDAVRVWVYKMKKSIRSAAISDSQPTPPSGNQAVPHCLERQLLFDVSELVRRDVHTGVQRVVRSMALELLRHPPTGYKVELTYADDYGRLRYARDFARRLAEDVAVLGEDNVLEVVSGDIFFCPDLHLSYPFSSLMRLKCNGVRVIFTIHDIIALNKPQLLPKAYRFAFHDWFKEVMAVSDAVVCVSRSVAEDVITWLTQHPWLRPQALPIGYFHLGADIEASRPTQGRYAEGQHALANTQGRPTLLMVGTLEPRKGHAQALAAMEVLWKEGVDVNLVIVGKEGWRTQRLARQLRRHPERNRRLFWLEKASDALLMQMYDQSTALLAASYAEGFGLPLIEAARHGLPIIARDIPIFREVAGEFAFYFPNADHTAIASSLLEWFQLYEHGIVPQSKDMPYLTWRQSTEQVLHIILDNSWYDTYFPAENHGQ
jgi:glycosyltransferase involved in cell wall biosynthesis